MGLADEARRHGLDSTNGSVPSRPKVALDDSGRGFAEAVVRDGDDFDAILARMFPEIPVDVLEVLEVRAWGDPDQPYKYVKARVARRLDGGKTGRELLASIPRRKARKRVGNVTSDRTLVVNVADMQLGKAFERGGGTPETIERVRSVTAQIPDRVRSMKRMGRPVSRIVVANMGDTCEGVANHYSTQTFTVDLNEADQVAVAIDLYDDIVDVCAGLVPDVVCTVVNSNHDRPRQGGKYITDATDSKAFTVWRALARAYGKAPERYGHVKWHIPSDPLVSTLDLHGVGVAFCHGHEANRGSIPVAKLWNWWDGQIAGRLPAGDCDVLVAAHFHHAYLLQQQGRTLVGCPALDGGSQWLTNRAGVWSDPGLLTFTIDGDGFDDFHVIRP